MQIESFCANLWRLRFNAVQSRGLQQCRNSSYQPFQANDAVILRRKHQPSSSAIFIDRLRPGKRKDTHRGPIQHDDIIGKHARDLVKTTVVNSTKSGIEYRLHQVRLDEYVTSKKRLVTPLYPQDAQIIVNLLDLHPDPPRPEEDVDPGTRLEILEAGTGHGGLTLFLSRAIHAANPPRPISPPEAEPSTLDEMLESWKPTRRAIIHSIETSPRYSAHAATVVRDFRHGLYYGNIDFHVADVGEWITSTLASRGDKPFLSHAFLDMPGSDAQLKAVSQALRPDGTLIVFNPSISQIMEAVKRAKSERLFLELDRVVELGVNGGCGGREWDVRAVIPRALQKIPSDTIPTPTPTSTLTESDSSPTEPLPESDHSEISASSSEDILTDEVERDWKMVCRPKVGEMIVGGGFLGVFRKQKNMQSEDDV